MDHNQQQFNQPSAAAYPPPPTSTAPGPYVTAPPAGYPMSKDESQKPVAVETKSRGDGFWKGCCAALCCCCLLDACF
ncbi:Cysteine-Rich Transmembrane Module 4 [Hibiscus trionum]|uniref:Cysteine-Rich Transmembrane Module 4 n=1 Tax=Hibiscus trionum TaxID=183268 RepID=A0A9W7I123_HIBTR|nr:Cysteine-Rich Transmembrane Module 4 [Hibiscus trionum]